MRTVCFSDSKKDRLNNHLSPYEYLQMRHRCVSVALHRQDNEKAANQEWRFANMVYPEFSPTASLRAASNETHNGVWAIPESLAQRYCEFLDPVILRRSVATQTANASSICNFAKQKAEHMTMFWFIQLPIWPLGCKMPRRIWSRRHAPSSMLQLLGRGSALASWLLTIK